MPTTQIVERLDVFEYVGSGLVAGIAILAMRSSDLERCELALYRNVVPDISSPANVAGRTVTLPRLVGGFELKTTCF